MLVGIIERPVYTVRMSSVPEENVNFDSEPVLQLEVDGIDYRLDSGKEGTALGISHRESGTWDWQFLGEAKWDRTQIRCKALHRSVLEKLARELRQLD